MWFCSHEVSLAGTNTCLWFATWFQSSPQTFQVAQTKFWPSCQTPPGCWAPRLEEEVSASARCWTEPRGHTDTSSLTQTPRPTMPCWCWIRALGTTSDTRWASSMWMWMWPRRDAPMWMVFIWVSPNTLNEAQFPLWKYWKLLCNLFYLY